MLPAEEELLVLLSYSAHDAAETARARALAAQKPDWSTLWELAELNATAPLVHWNLERLKLLAALPAQVKERFEHASAAVKQANQARLAVAKPLFARFAERRIPVVILKGALFAETLYRNSNYKKMNDVDILVRKQDLDAIYDLYEQLGFFSAAELVGGSPRKQEKFSHHAPPFFSRDLRCMVGTHWGLITPLAPYTLDYDAIWSRVVDIDFHGHPAQSMAPEDNLHHLCVHLPYYKCGVRELADIYNLVRQVGDGFDWELLYREVAKAGTENLVYHALSLADALSPMPAVAAALARVEPAVSYYFRRDTARKVQSVSRLLRGRTAHMSRIEKAFADLNATQEASEKWQAFGRMWANILAPPEADVLKMNALEQARGMELWGARLAAPLRIYRVFARDVGGKMFFAIMAKCAYECVRETVRAPFGGPAVQQNYQAFADRLGVTVADLERLKEALE